MFNFNPREDSETLSPVSNGSLRLEMRFRGQQHNMATLVAYTCYDSIMKVDSKQRVLIDYY